jgi:hypothetical protein
MLTLAEVAYLADASPKWVLNTCSALGLHDAYTLALARRLYVVRLLQHAAGCSLERAAALAVRLLQGGGESNAPAVVSAALDDHGTLSLQLDVARLHSTFAARRSALSTTVAPHVRGRPSSREQGPLEAARAWGLDLSLLASNLRRTPTERLRQLDAMADFRRRVRRPVASEGS